MSWDGRAIGLGCSSGILNQEWPVWPERVTIIREEVGQNRTTLIYYKLQRKIVHTVH